METHKAKCGGYGMFTRICWIFILGILFGLALGLPFPPESGWTLSDASAVFANGIALAYLVLAALDWLVQVLALSRNPLPADLDLSDRSVARERATALAGNALLHRHLRRLLTAWGSGASGSQVATMAASQMHRLMASLAAEAITVIILLSAAAGFAAPGWLLTLGTGLLAAAAVVGLARFQLASQSAGYIESHLLAKIGNDTPAAAGLDFAKAVGKSVTDSVASLATAQAKFTEQLAKTQQEATALTAKAQQETAALLAKAQQDASAQLAKAHQEAAAPIAKAHQEAASQVVKAQQDAAAQIAKAQQDAASQVAQAQTDMASRLTTTQEQSASQLAKAQTVIAEQLGRITQLASTIDRVLQLQQAVDATLKGVAVTDEFKSTLVELKRHLAESDQLLKNATKPRTIRLVEKDNE